MTILQENLKKRGFMKPRLKIAGLSNQDNLKLF